MIYLYVYKIDVLIKKNLEIAITSEYILHQSEIFPHKPLAKNLLAVYKVY